MNRLEGIRKIIKELKIYKKHLISLKSPYEIFDKNK